MLDIVLGSWLVELHQENILSRSKVHHPGGLALITSSSTISRSKSGHASLFNSPNKSYLQIPISRKFHRNSMSLKANPGIICRVDSLRVSENKNTPPINFSNFSHRSFL